jgi:hypothetical protein
MQVRALLFSADPSRYFQPPQAPPVPAAAASRPLVPTSATSGSHLSPDPILSVVSLPTQISPAGRGRGNTEGRRRTN